MRGKYHVLFCNDLGLTIELLEGDIYPEDLAQMIEKQVCHPQYEVSNNVLTDVRKARLHITEADMEKFVKYLSGYGFLMIEKKVALLTNEPNHVVASTLFALNMEESNHPHQIGIYSTTEAVLQWLNLSWNVQEYEDMIKDPTNSACFLFTSE